LDPEFIVTGVRLPDGGWLGGYSPEGEGGGPYPEPRLAPTGEDGGGGTLDPIYLAFTEDRDLLRARIRVLILRAAELIRQKPDWKEREYAALVYVDQYGRLKLDIILVGETVAEARASGTYPPRTIITLPEDIGMGFVVGLIHSHADVGYDDAADLQNRYPSSGDYDYLDRNRSDPAFRSYELFWHYILGPDGKVREFSVDDGQVDPNNDPAGDARIIG